MKKNKQCQFCGFEKENKKNEYCDYCNHRWEKAREETENITYANHLEEIKKE